MRDRIKSAMKMKTARANETTSTIVVEALNSSRVGQVTFPISLRTSLTNWAIFPNMGRAFLVAGGTESALPDGR